MNLLLGLIKKPPDYESTHATQFSFNNDFESTHATHFSLNNDFESTHATHFIKTDYESTQATLDQNWAHDRYRLLRLCIKIGMCV